MRVSKRTCHLQNNSISMPCKQIQIHSMLVINA